MDCLIYKKLVGIGLNMKKDTKECLENLFKSLNIDFEIKEQKIKGLYKNSNKKKTIVTEKDYEEFANLRKIIENNGYDLSFLDSELYFNLNNFKKYINGV
jgi:hypothetical protein